MPLGIPLPNAVPWFDLTVELDGVTYTLEWHWNVRANDGAGAWYLSVLDGDGVEVILAGVQGVADYALGVGATARRFPGYLVLWDTTGNHEDPRFDDLGERHRLLYFTAAELGKTAAVG